MSDSIPNTVSHLSNYDRTSGPRQTLRRHTDSRDTAPRTPSGDGERKRFVAKGHDRLLENAQYGKNRVRLAMMDGTNVYGQIVARDKFTITVLHEQNGSDISGLSECFYKHAIQGVLMFPNRDSQE